MMRSGDDGRTIVRFLTSFDYIQLAALAVLLAIGVLFIHSTGVQIGSPAAMEYYLRQLQWILLGSIGYLILSCIDFRRVELYLALSYPACIALLLEVLFFGTRVWGARRWISMPGLQTRIQPSEFMKLGLIFMLAALFSSRMFTIDPEEMNSRSRHPSQGLTVLLAAGLIALPFMLIVRQPDLGSALVLPFIGAAMIFAAGIRGRFLAWMLTALLAVVLLAGINEFWPKRVVNPASGAVTLTYPGIHPFLHNYQRERMLTFFDPERDLVKYGYNRHQALLAVGSGGFSGKGIGKGTQNLLGFLPQSVSSNDFIFAVIAEETGFIGCMVLFGTYLLLFYSILRTALITDSAFGRYTAIGTAAMLFIHIFINAGMSVGVMPVTGLSLPFVSYGGSFILTGMAALGVLQSVYRFRDRD